MAKTLPVGETCAARRFKKHFHDDDTDSRGSLRRAARWERSARAKELPFEVFGMQPSRQENVHPQPTCAPRTVGSGGAAKGIAAFLLAWLTTSCLTSTFVAAQSFGTPPPVASEAASAASGPPANGAAASAATAPNPGSPAPNASAPSTSAAPTSAVPGAPQPVFTRDLGFSIPFSVEALAANVVEVQLLVSVDRGTTWHPYARQLPADKAFRFRASRDGEYWFSSRTVDRQGQTRPPGQPQAQLIVVIDTNLPKIQLLATPGPAGEVTVRWEISDERLAPETFQLFYLAGVTGVPQPVVVPASLPTGVGGAYHGQVTFWPQGGGRLAQLTAEVKDAAGNRAVAGKRVYLNPATRARPGAAAAVPFAASSSSPPPYAPPPYVPPGSAAPAASPATQSSATASVPGAAPPTAPSGQGWTTAAPGAAAGPGMLVGGSAARGASDGTGSNPGNSTSPPSSAAGTLGGDLPGGERPRMTNSKRFALEYDIESAGPGGVSDVELWATRDRGTSWTKMATDADKQSPFDVTVDEEGVYGFRVVVVSKSGLVSSAPRAGDLADIWVGVDVTAPKVQFSSISFGEGDEAGKLDIRWEADDLRMSPRPVTLSYAENPGGPWTAFANGLPNNGQYSWSIAGQVPKRVLLRIEVRDDAGNVGAYQLAEPISLQGLNPAGRIRGFTPAAAPASGAKRQPLFAPRRL